MTYIQTLRLFNRNVYFFLLTTVIVGFGIDGGIYSVLFNLYLLRLGYGPEFVGLVNSAGLLTFALASFPAGIIGGRWSSRRMVIIGLGLTCLGSALLPLANFGPNGWQRAGLFSGNILLYLGLACYYVNAAPFLLGSTGPAERNYVISTQVAFLSISAFAGSLMGGILPGLFAGWLGRSLDRPEMYGYPLLLVAGLLIPAMLTMLVAQEPVDEPDSTPAATAGKLKVRNAALGILAVMTLIRLFQVAGVGTASTFFNVYMDAGLHVSTSQIGLLAAIGRLLAVPAALITPILTARRGNGVVALWGSFASAIVMLPLALSSHWAAAGFGFIAITAISSIRYPAFLVYSLELVPPRQRGAMSGAGEMAAGFSFSAMALSGGYIITSLGYQNLFLIGSSLSLLGTAIFWVYYRRTQGRKMGI